MDDSDTEETGHQDVSIEVSSSDILRLIMAHLTEAGLHETARCLRQESGVGMKASLTSSSVWKAQMVGGNFADVLRGLSVMDETHIEDTNLLAEVHDHVILELADQAEWECAYSVFRLAQQRFDCKVEQKLAELAALREKDPECSVPNDYYTPSKETRRVELGTRLEASIPQQPLQRLPTLLQDAVRWGNYTGQIPDVKQFFGEEAAAATTKKRKFDLVLGEVDAGFTVTTESSKKPKKIKKQYTEVKFGKKVACESAAFLPNGHGFVTGTSDGLIEIWNNDAKLLDLPFQNSEDFLGHDTKVTALAVSNDSTMLASGSDDSIVQVWRLDTGKCLRKLQVATSRQGVSAVSFSPEGSQILVACQDGTCREFGLRASKLLKEFRGHSSFITCCSYELITVDDERELLVITASGDGSIRLWNGKTAEIMHVFKPVSVGPRSSLSKPGSSIVVASSTDTISDNAQYPIIHSVLKLHTPKQSMIVVPRGVRAFLVENPSGRVVRTFQDDSTASEAVFVAATVNSSNRWLYAAKDNGDCCIFDVGTGKLEKTIHDFGSSEAEVTFMVHHPQKNLLAAFSNSPNQKKGRLALWK